MPWYIPFGLALLLTGCGLIDTVKVKGATAYDEGLANAEWFVCQGASVGSVIRRYGSSVELSEAWRALCLGDPNAVIIVAREPR